jgi:hypothetical protein
MVEQLLSQQFGRPREPLSFNIEEASILSENNILMPPRWKLPHGWRITAGGMAVPPIPLEAPTMTAYIKHRSRALPLEQRNNPDW